MSNNKRKVIHLSDLNPEDYPDDRNNKREKEVSRCDSVPDHDKRTGDLPIQTQTE